MSTRAISVSRVTRAALLLRDHKSRCRLRAIAFGDRCSHPKRMSRTAALVGQFGTVQSKYLGPAGSIHGLIHAVNVLPPSSDSQTSASQRDAQACEFGKNVDQETESRFDWRYETTNDCIDIGALLFRSGIVLRRRSTDGHMEAQRN